MVCVELCLGGVVWSSVWVGCVELCLSECVELCLGNVCGVELCLGGVFVDVLSSASAAVDYNVRENVGLSREI